MYTRSLKPILNVGKFDTLFDIGIFSWNLINLSVEVNFLMPEIM